MIVLRSLLIGLVFCVVLSRAAAATLPAGFAETQISVLSRATAMAIAPAGRIFVCLQGGSLGLANFSMARSAAGDKEQNEEINSKRIPAN